MNKWMSIGIAGVALAGSLASAGEIPKEEAKTQPEIKQDGEFSIEASDLIAKKLRDYVRVEIEA